MTLPQIIIVGLGPAGPEFVTAQTTAAVAAAQHRYIRTTRHPSASMMGDSTSFDEIYEHADTFDDVYSEICRRLVAAATEHGEILYAVPGSPLVLERTVRHLLADASVSCTVLPAMSFLDIAYARLGIDPVEAGVTLIDGHTFASSAAGRSGPLLIAHTHANWVISDIKLAAESAAGDELVIVLQRLGSPDEAVVETTWAAMDQAVDADHLTSLYVPHLGAPVGVEMVRFHQLARTLREQCPWDTEQTHASLERYLVEETYELVDAIRALDPDDSSTDEALIEELGDVLYQVEFHATIAEQQGRFTMADVAAGIHDKLVRRHPHIFGDVVADDVGTVLGNWEQIKQAEKGRTSVFDGVARSQPSLAYAETVQRKAAKVGFDWLNVDGAWPKITEETSELHEAMADGNASAMADELGDLLFAVVNVARHLGIDAEQALRAATDKFRQRFAGVERLAAERGLVLKSTDLATLDALWDEVKLLG